MRTRLASVVALCVGLTSPIVATGQEDAGEDVWAGVEEMLVTGSSSAGLLADVSTSAIAFDAEELQDIGAQDVSDLARFTPSLEINTTSATTPTFFIRGVGLNDSNANAAGAISIYVDDVPINAAPIQLAGLFDTETVEVLRGPQAYIDARNASGGMINTVSKKPNGEFSAFVRGDYGNFGAYDLEGALGFPIFGEALSGRIAFRRTFRDGLINNRCGGLVEPDTGRRPNTCFEPTSVTRGEVPAGLDRKTNDTNRWAARAQVRFAPDSLPYEMEWIANFHTSRVDQTAIQGQAIGTLAAPTGQPSNRLRYVDPAISDVFNGFRDALRAQGIRGRTIGEIARAQTLELVTRNIENADPFSNDYDLDGIETLSQLGGFLRGTMQFGEVSFKTVTGIERWDRELDRDFDFGSSPAITSFREDDAYQFSQNINLSTELEALPIRLAGGGYFLTELLDSDSNFTLRTGRTELQTQRFLQNYEQDLFSFGVFGSFEWDLLENLTLEAGARANWERKDFTLGVRRIQFGSLLPAPPETELTRTWSAPTYGFNLSYRFTEDILAYVKYTRGWKAGHINANVLEIDNAAGVVATPTVAQPETIDSVEFGIDVSALNGFVDAKASAFYYKYDNYQVFLIESEAGAAPQLQILNANSAQVYGVEADLTVRPFNLFDAPESIAGLKLSMNFAWLESKFLDFSDIRTAILPSDPSTGEVLFGTYTVDFTGNRLPNTPKFKISGTVQWAFDLAGFGVITPRYDITWTDDIFFDPSEGVATPRFGELSTVFPDYLVGQRAYALHDLRLSYSDPSNVITISGWVRNLTNEVYKRNVFDLTTAFDQVNNFVGDPRTYGFSGTFRF